MIRITILCVGALKETWWKDAVREYAKRLSRYCRLDIIEVPDEKTPDGCGEAMEDRIREAEAAKVLKKFDDSAYTIALTIQGKSLDSVALSEHLDALSHKSGHIQILIGGSLGMHPTLIQKADEELSFSKMTFPHQLMRVILLEQLYRAFRISHHEPYHK